MVLVKTEESPLLKQLVSLQNVTNHFSVNRSRLKFLIINTSSITSTPVFFTLVNIFSTLTLLETILLISEGPYRPSPMPDHL